MRPVHLLELLVVVEEVAGRMEELLGHDGSAQADIRQLDDVAGLAHLLVALEVLAHRRHVELDDVVAVDAADAAFVECDQFHCYAPTILNPPSASR